MRLSVTQRIHFVSACRHFGPCEPAERHTTVSYLLLLDQHNIRRGFKQITKAGDLGEDWGSPGAAPYVRDHHVRGRRPDRGDRPASRSPADQHDGTGLPPRAAPVIVTGAEITDRIFSS